MVRKTRKGRIGAKAFAAIMSVTMGFSNLSMAMPGAVAFAETDSPETNVADELETSAASEEIVLEEESDEAVSGSEEIASEDVSVDAEETSDESTGASSEEATDEADSADSASSSASEDKAEESASKASSEAKKEEKKTEEKTSELTGSSDRTFDSSKTDVWDFGAENLGENYNNRLDVDTINGFYPDTVKAGSTGVCIQSFSIDDGDFSFDDGGVVDAAKGHRWRSTNESITRYDVKSLKDEDGNEYLGYIYSNKGSRSDIYVAVECKADDIITAYVASNSGNSTIHFQNMEDAEDDSSSVHTLGGSTVSKMIFYPSKDAKYKLYSEDEKLVVARVYREHAKYSIVTGTVTGYKGTGSFDVVFTNEQNGNTVAATVADGSFSAKLAQGFDYTLSLKGADDYVITSDKEVKISGDESLAVEVQQVDLVKVAGKISGVDDNDLEAFSKDAEFSFKPGDKDSVYVPKLSLKASGEFEVTLQKDIEYAVTVNGVDDYTLQTETVKYSKDESKAELVFVKKDAVPVVVTTDGIELSELKDSTFRFTLLNPEEEYAKTKYVYEFKGEDAIAGKVALRKGQYDVTVAGVPENYTQDDPHTKDAIVDEDHVKDGKLTIVIPFDKDEKETLAYAPTVTVGEGKDYATISEAIEAIRKMDRAEGQRVTVEIQPGNYQEMLVIDTPNVTFKNANAGASIEPVEQGVGISADSVRITGYYGHGYTYYSMGSDCKYDAELLEVNKYNGYASFANPGSGTTAGSYWNATVVVNAAGFEAQDIIFENSFNQYQSELAVEDVIVAQNGAKEGSEPRSSLTVGSTKVQDKTYVERAAALAMTQTATQAYFNHCAFIGRQDTLYGAVGSTEAYYNCDVYGGTDYIFGGMTAVFAKCDLVFNTSEDKNDVGYITAAQQTNANSRGYLMYNCTVKSTTPGGNTASAYESKPGYLGRPWQANTSEVVFFNTVIDATCDNFKGLSASLIRPEGWLSSLGGTTDRNVEYGTYEVSEVDNAASRVAWAPVSDKAETTDGKAITVSTFLGDWDPFKANGNDMTITFPDGSSQEEPVVEPEEPSKTTVFTFESKDLTSFSAGAKKDGDTEQVGTENYFTLLYSAKSKVDSSTKTWEDEYTSGQRVNFAGVASTEMNAVKFTTSNSATVKVWWAQGGDDSRQITILNGKGEAVDTTEGTWTKNSPYISTLKVNEAGTYYLGNAINNNYIFKVVVTEDVVAEPVTYTMETSALTAFAAGAKADGATEKAGTDDYFTLIYSEKSKVDKSEKTWDDYASAQRVNFGGVVSVEKNAIKFTTSGEASVKVWWAQGGEDSRQVAILDSAGAVAATTEGTWVKNTAYVSTLKLDKAGTYYLGGNPNNNYFFKVEVTEGGAAPVVERKDWDLVDEPVVKSVALNETDPGKIDVTVSALIGTDGGDKLTAYMLTGDPAKGEREILKTLNSTATKDEFTFSFAPTASGKYFFAASLSRDDADYTLESTETELFDFFLPLTAPEFKNAVNQGKGKVKTTFYSVKEATSYVLTATDKADETKKFTKKFTPKKADENTSTEYTNIFTGLTPDHTYVLSVYAVRAKTGAEGADENSKTSTLEIKATQAAEEEWVFSAFGQGVSSGSNCGYTKNEDGSVTVWNTGSKGKLVPKSTDGLSFYYTAVPASKNFTFTAKAKIDTWTFTNGQEGFGLMAADRVGVNGDSSAFWNNSYMASGTKVEYYYDKEAGKVTNVDTADKITMKLGLGSQEKTGVTQQNLALMEAGDLTGFSSTMYPLETSCGNSGQEDYNLFGNASEAVKGTVENPITEVTLRIQKNNTGYFVSYLDNDGNELYTKKYYDTKALQKLDTKYVYVGVFAARTFKATFSDMELTLIDPSKDAKPEGREIEYVDPNYKIVSATVSNTEKYVLQYTGNADGILTITDARGYALVNAKAVKSGAAEKVAVRLAKGDNTFKVAFTPNKTYRPGGDAYKRLSNYDPVNFEHTVKYSTISSAEKIYVAPNGTKDGDGTEANPVDIYTATSFVQPGQTISLAAGEYKLSETVIVDRGIDGTADKPIKMVAENGRAIFDFQSECAGFIFAGNYWYIKGIDCTKSKDAQKGIQVSGSHITIEDVRTYENGNTGIQISRYLGSDKRADWPSYVLVLNCTSYGNKDKGSEDADGFAAKLTCGEGIVFDGCISYNNADDGWDLFAKVETGSIGQVTIQNCVAFENGYCLDGTNKGNGNGFKMGGDSLAGSHKLINSVAWGNKKKGIDSNSCPDNQVYHSMSFNNGGSNVALYTNDAANTNYIVDGVLSYRTENKTQNEDYKPKGTQEDSRVYGEKNFYWNDGESSNLLGLKPTDDWFVSLNAPKTDYNNPYAVAAAMRAADGSIDLGGFLKLTDKAVNALAAAGIKASDVAASLGGCYDAVADERAIDGSVNDVYQSIEGFTVENFKTQLTYTGNKLTQDMDVYYGDDLLKEGVDYSVAYKNNVNAGTAVVTITGKGNYSGKTIETFVIAPEDINKAAVTVKAVNETGNEAKGKYPTVTATVTYMGKTLTAKKDYTLAVDWTAEPVQQDGYKEYPVTITAVGDTAKRLANFCGEKTGLKVKVYPKGKKAVTDSNLTTIKNGSVEIEKTAYDFTGSKIEPAVTVFTGKGTKKGEPVDASKYTVKYTANINKGTATITVSGIEAEGYTGTLTKKFTIAAVEMNKAEIEMDATVEYTKGGAKPVPTVSFKLENGNYVTLREGVDYKLTYANNNKVGVTGKSEPKITITGLKNFKNSVVKTFAITAKDVATTKVVTTDKAVKKNAKGTYLISKPVVYDENGKKLVEKTDYTLKFFYGENEIDSKTALVEGNSTVKVVVTGTKAYTGETTAYYQVRTLQKLSTVYSDKIADQKYTGREVRPDGSIKLYIKTGSGKTQAKKYLVKDADYEVVLCFNNVKQGTATYVLKGKGDYSGYKTVTFKITKAKIK